MKKLITTIKNLFLTGTFLVCGTLFAQQSGKPTVAIPAFDSKGVIHDATAVAYMVRLEVEKTGVYAVMDKYDMNDILTKNNIDVKTCLGKTCLLEAGKLLGVQKVITGAVERFAEKIVITMRVIDVTSGGIEKTEATEYLNLQPELQHMIEISVKKMLGIAPDPNVVALLIDYEQPITSPKTSYKLNGPRMGASMTFGENAERLTAPLNEGGFDMYPITSQFGWQLEHQYMSAGNFQALVEGIFMIGGLENGKMIPSATLLNGFRFSKVGWEFGVGPTFRIVQKAQGFYDHTGVFGDKGDWHLKSELYSAQNLDTLGQFISNPADYEVVSRVDSRGNYSLSTGLVIAVGKTFRSGYLNIPFNAYVSPRKEGTIVGFSFGFNIAKKPKVQY